MLKLIYHNAVFGPIDLEYDGPVVRVGRSEDNDLVLRHPSVEDHHCMLVFRGEQVLCLPPDDTIFSETDLKSLVGPEYGAGDQITIGKLRFRLAHSARTVAIPDAQSPEAGADVLEGDSATGAGEGARPPRYFCAHCRVFIPHAEAKRLGVVGHAKRYLCPKCSGLLDVEPEPPKSSPTRKGLLRRAMRNLTTSSSAEP